MTVSLEPYPASPGRAVSALEATVDRKAGGVLVFRYRIEGHLAAVTLPPSAKTAFVEGLWKHTCFEAFVAAAEDPAYRELNFSPSGEWAAFAFRRYREGDASAPRGPAPTITTRRSGDGFELRATARLESFLPERERWRVGLSAVIESADGSLSYWALAHPAARPDFHHPDSFTLSLDPPECYST